PDRLLRGPRTSPGAEGAARLHARKARPGRVHLPDDPERLWAARDRWTGRAIPTRALPAGPSARCSTATSGARRYAVRRGKIPNAYIEPGTRARSEVHPPEDHRASPRR